MSGPSLCLGTKGNAYTFSPSISVIEMEKESKWHLYGLSYWRRHWLNYKDHVPMKRKTKIHIPPVHFTKNGARAWQWNYIFTVLLTYTVHKLNGTSHSLECSKRERISRETVVVKLGCYPIMCLEGLRKITKKSARTLSVLLMGANIFWNSRSHLNTVGTRRVTGSKVHTEDIQVLRTIIQNVFTWRSNAHNLRNPV
jgi:hypothetical protein